MFEKRASERRRVSKTARIVYNRGNSAIDCTVRNISTTGLQVRVQNALTIPQKFELRWNGRATACAVVWRKMDSLGVRFDD